MKKLSQLLGYSQLANSFGVHPHDAGFCEGDLAKINFSEKDRIECITREVAELEKDIEDLPRVFNHQEFVDKTNKARLGRISLEKETIGRIEKEIEQAREKHVEMESLRVWVAGLDCSTENAKLNEFVVNSGQTIRAQAIEAFALMRGKINLADILKELLREKMAEMAESMDDRLLTADNYLKAQITNRKLRISELSEEKEIIQAIVSEREQLLADVIKLANGE
jgi:hypothetical protein